MASGSFSGTYKGYTVKTVWSSTPNTAGNYSTITGTHYLVCGSGWDLYIGSRTNSCTAGETKSFTSSSISTSGGSTITLGTTTHTVNHDSDGKKTINASTTFNIQATISGSYVSSITASGTMVLDNIPRASSLTASNGTLGTAQTLTINKAADSFTHTITYTCGSASGTITTKTSNASVSWTPPLSLASQNTISTNVTITLTITTYNGDTSIGTSTKTITCAIPSSVVPTCAISVSDPTGYASTYGGYIQGISKFKVVVTGTIAYGSPIASYNTTANGVTYTSSSFTTDVIKNFGTLTITGKVTDKRGRSGTASTTATVLEYSKPKITKLSVSRCDSDGTENMQGDYVNVKYSCSITSLNSQNTLSTAVKYKKTTENEYTSQTDIESSTTASYTDRSVVIAMDSDSSYDIELSITDNFDTTTRTTSVSTAFAFMHFKGPNDDIYSKNIFDFTQEPTDESYVTVSQLDNGVRVTLSQDTTTAMAKYIFLERSDYVGKTIRARCDITASSSDMTKTRLGLGYYTKTGGSGTYSYVSGSETISLTVTSQSDTDNKTYIGILLILTHGQSTSAGNYADFTNIIVTVDNEDMTYEPYYIIPAYKASMGLGKVAEFEGGLDVGFPIKFNGNIYDQFGQLIGNGLAEYESAGIDANTTLSNLILTNVNTPNSYYCYVMTMFYSTKSETARRTQIAVPYQYDSSQNRKHLYVRQNLDGTWNDWYDSSEGIVLYDNSSGSSGAITLSKSAANFNYLEIYFTDNNDKYGGYTKIYSPNSKTIQLSLIEPSSDTITYIRRTKYYITDKTIALLNSASAGYVMISSGTVSHTTGTNYIKIVRVVGYV